MIINGQTIAQKIYQKLKPSITQLKQQGIRPTLLIILVGQNYPSSVYVRQKKMMGESLGLRVIICSYPSNISEKIILNKIQECNQNPAIHGIVVQLPLPKNLNSQKIIQSVQKEKDVDGFLPNSFPSPLANAVVLILKKIKPQKLTLATWLQQQKIVILGKGKTAGEPIFKKLVKLNQNLIQLDKITHSQKILKTADIVISCVGKKRVIKPAFLKKGVILIGVGLHEENGKLKGDYEEKEIKKIASFYTPTPYGVGPVNVACLLKNVVLACLKTIKK